MSIVAVKGVVVEGRRLGRELGFPTANILLSEGLNIENGVYRSRVEILGVWHHAVTNVGVNPTVGEVSRRAESFILDFEGDIYGLEISVELCEMLRAEEQFESVDALRCQIARDIERVNEILRELTRC